jgi:hypothetical protein
MSCGGFHWVVVRRSGGGLGRGCRFGGGTWLRFVGVLVLVLLERSGRWAGWLMVAGGSVADGSSRKK